MMKTFLEFLIEQSENQDKSKEFTQKIQFHHMEFEDRHKFGKESERYIAKKLKQRKRVIIEPASADDDLYRGIDGYLVKNGSRIPIQMKTNVGKSSIDSYVFDVLYFYFDHIDKWNTIFQVEPKHIPWLKSIMDIVSGCISGQLPDKILGKEFKSEAKIYYLLNKDWTKIYEANANRIKEEVWKALKELSNDKECNGNFYQSNHKFKSSTGVFILRVRHPFRYDAYKILAFVPAQLVATDVIETGRNVPPPSIFGN